MSNDAQGQDAMTLDGNGVACAVPQLRRCLPPLKAHALWAKTYDSDPNPLLSLEERVVLPLLHNLKDLFVLDVACGTGRWLARVADLGVRRGAGLDLSPEMLAQARSKQSLHHRLVRADCTSMPITANIIDLALCSFAVSYVARLERFARELSRVVKSRGRLILTDFHPSCHLRGWRRAFRYTGGIIEILDFQYSIEEICAAFRLNGFELETILTPSFGEPERAIFTHYGKEAVFDRAREGPVIVVCCFRLGSPDVPGKGR